MTFKYSSITKVKNVIPNTSIRLRKKFSCYYHGYNEAHTIERNTSMRNRNTKNIEMSNNLIIFLAGNQKFQISNFIIIKSKK